MSLIGNISSWLGNGQSEDDLINENKRLDQELKERQAQRASARPDLFATPEYERDFHAHLDRQQQDTANIDQSINDEFWKGGKDAADKWKKFLTLLAWLAGIGVVIYLAGPAIRGLLKKKAAA
jgi:hypothetical protein